MPDLNWAAEPMEVPVADVMAMTIGMTPTERGAFYNLYFAYWLNGGPLANDDITLRSIAGCSEADWQRTKGVVGRRFNCSNGTWRSAQIDAMLDARRKSKEAIQRASAAGVAARREAGQLPPAVQPSVQPPVAGGAGRISLEKQLERVEDRIRALQRLGKHTAHGVFYEPKDKQELKKMKERKDELLKQLNWAV